MDTVILEFEHVSGDAKKGFVLSDVSFCLPAGYIMGLAGKNGAGKTTLLDYIVNPYKKYDGIIRICGEDIRKNHAKMQNQIGFVSGENHFLLERSAKQNAEILGMMYDKWDMEYFMEIMRMMELPAQRVVGKMSRGELMRFQMAFAMAHHPVIYLLDEVTAGMDPVFRMDFFKVLQKVIENEDAAVLMTSHIEEEMQRRMDYVGILENGKLVSFGESNGGTV